MLQQDPRCPNAKWHDCAMVSFCNELFLIQNSATYWEGKADAESLQRIYGISFPDAKQMKEWKAFQEEAAKRDHRKIGREQELFFFHELSPGSCFFLPKGTHIYNTLIDFIKVRYISVQQEFNVL